MVGHFSAPLIDADPGWLDGERFVIRRGFRYYLTDNEAGEFVDVPANFVTNFASTPRLLWNLFPPTGSYAQAAVVHDKLFLAPVVRTAHGARPCPFAETPGIFLSAAEACGTGWFARRIMYRMLQAFSRPSWDQYRANDDPGPISTWPEFERERVSARKAGLV
jgi:hypothetical protein